MENEAQPRRDRLKLTRVWDLLVREGYDSSYCSVRRYAARWCWRSRRRRAMGVMAFVPVMFQPGEAFPFDFSHEDEEISGQKSIGWTGGPPIEVSYLSRVINFPLVR